MFCSSVSMVSLNHRPHLCGGPLHATGKTPERGEKQAVGEKRRRGDPFKEDQKGECRQRTKDRQEMRAGGGETGAMRRGVDGGRTKFPNSLAEN